MTSKKLSKAQADVLHKMANGWELASSMTMDGRSWIQEGGAGSGGKFANVHWSTISALLKRGLIEKFLRDFPTLTYRLTDAGAQIAKENPNGD